MAAPQEENEQHGGEALLKSYLGISFSLFLASLPGNSRVNKEMKTRLTKAEEQLRQMKSRRKEDSKANARVVEIFASHRNTWQSEEKRLVLQIEAATEELASLRSKIEELEWEKLESDKRVQELEEMIGFMSRRGCEFEEYGGEHLQEEFGVCETSGCYGGGGGDEGQNGNLGFNTQFLASPSKFWAEHANLWQDVQYESQYESVESMYHMKNFVARRESPWKVDGESTGISTKLKLLEQELLNLEKSGESDLSKVPTVMKKQAKRYQALLGKIDDLCRRMVSSDPCESTLSPEFHTQRQTECLLEAFRLQQRASETGQKLIALQAEVGKVYYGDELGSQSKVATRRSLDSIRNNLKEIQRNFEIWLARIIGDLEGILARDSGSRARECYLSSRYPFVR